MPRDIEINFSPEAQIPGITLRYASHEEYPGHGAPCLLIFPNSGNSNSLTIAQRVQRELNTLPDNVNLLSAEVNRANMFNSFTTAHGGLWDYPNTQGKHACAGGEHTYIDAIRREDLGTVAAKALRLMLKNKDIPREDYDRAMIRLHAEGLEPAAHFSGRQGNASVETDLLEQHI